MSGIRQPYYDDRIKPEGYDEAPDPYKCYSEGAVNLAELAAYVRSSGKQPTDFSKEEMERFLIVS